MSEKSWVEWFLAQSQFDRNLMAVKAIERLMELEEVSFQREDACCDGEDDVIEACLFWDGSGEDIRHG